MPQSWTTNRVFSCFSFLLSPFCTGTMKSNHSDYQENSHDPGSILCLSLFYAAFRVLRLLLCRKGGSRVKLDILNLNLVDLNLLKLAKVLSRCIS